MSKPVYRFKFSSEMQNFINNFAQRNKYLDRVEYKETWFKFLEINKELIDKENERLIALGYKGNIKEKMFKSGRYYFKNKSSEKTIPKKRKQYKQISNDTKQIVFDHVYKSQQERLKPADAFSEFIKIYPQFDKDNQIKKCYKNRYFNNTIIYE